MTSDLSGEQPLLLVDSRDAVTQLTLNRPRQFNALSQALMNAVQDALDTIAADRSVRVVILNAQGRGFCSGHDLKEMRSLRERSDHQALFEQCSQMMMTINRLPQPVIASVHGIATAAGCQLVASCDLAVAGESAKFAVNGIDQGLFCSTPSVALSRNLSRKHALKMLLTGEFLDAWTAREFGLINDVVPDESLSEATWALAERIATKSPNALHIGKTLFYEQLARPLDEAYALAAETMACNMDSDDAREGIDAFFEKRHPVWSN